LRVLYTVGSRVKWGSSLADKGIQPASRRSDMTAKKDDPEGNRMILLLTKMEFPSMDDSDLENISPHQRRSYRGQVTRFLQLVELFGYSKSGE